MWLLVILASIGAALMSVLRTGRDQTNYRIHLRRAEWAREACVAAALAQYRPSEPPVRIDSLDLGGGLWCRGRAASPAARLNVNVADEEVLRRLLGSQALTNALLDWRDADSLPREQGAEFEEYRRAGRLPPRNGPLAAVAELRFVRGFEDLDMAQLEATFTVEGDGRLDLGRAAPEILVALPWFDGSDIALLEVLQRDGLHQLSPEDLLSRMGESRRAALSPKLAEMRRQLVASSPDFLYEIEGVSGKPAVLARGRLSVVALPDRLAIIQKVVW
jgi:hypothetical protein